MADNEKNAEENTELTAEKKRKIRRKRLKVLLIIALIFIVIGVAWLLYYYLVLQFEESTDDAYVQGNMVTISPQTSGTVIGINADDTDRVVAGQVLVRLDPVDAETQLLSAEGQLAQAVRDARQARFAATQADAAVIQREAQYAMQRSNFERRSPLLQMRAVSPEDVENNQQNLKAAAASVDEARAQAKEQHARAGNTDIRSFPSVIQARAQFRSAWINHVRDAIVSPIDGYVANRQVQVGERVQSGQSLMSIIPLNNLWVDANFKETQLENIRIGQSASVTADMYPDITYHGHVVGLTPATGSSLSLLPAQNATGNWVKIVQRLAVRIALDPDELKKHPLRVGLSTSVDVNTTDRNGTVLADAPRTTPVQETDVYQQELNEANAAADHIIEQNMGTTAQHTAASRTPSASSLMREAH